MSRRNALHNCTNPNQGMYARILCVCSAGLLRSPTLAELLIKRGYNARAAGVHDYALVPIDDVLIEWADIIICADADKLELLGNKYADKLENKTVYNFNIPDIYEYRNPELVKIIQEQCIKQGVVDAES